MITFAQSDYRRELYICGGWNLSPDDDLPNQPECPLDSAQRKRYLKSAPTRCSHRQPDGGNVEEQRAVT